MLDCRYYDLCCFTDDSCNGEQECPKRDYCQFYSPMPDRDARLALADEMEGDARYWLNLPCDQLGSRDVIGYADRIREACGVVDAG